MASTPSYKRVCSYNGCLSNNLTTNGGAISFFGFPKDTERCSKWITNSGREEFRYLNPNELRRKTICELHFAGCMFSNKFKTHLKRYAFPRNWKNSTPELIQIDEDEENLYDDLGDGNEPVDVTVTVDDVQELSDDDVQNEQSSLNVPVNYSSTDNLVSSANSEASGNTIGEHGEHQPTESESVTNSNDSESPLVIQESHSLSAVTSTSRTTVEETCPSEKTKFHNLPSQTTPGEFYYQQCPSLDETNHSYPEPPEVEMPLFVQQNSAATMAEEAGNNSESSEPPAKRRRRGVETELTDQMKDAMKYLKDITELLTTSEDEFELFGKSVALQLKKMSLCTALTVQAKIQNVLSQYRINDIKNKSPGQANGQVNSNCVGDDQSEFEDEHEDNLEKQDFPPPSVECVSETSDNEEK